MKFFIILAFAIFGANAVPAVKDDVIDPASKFIQLILDFFSDPLLNIHDKEVTLDSGFEVLKFTFKDVVISGTKNETTTLTFNNNSGLFKYELNFAKIQLDIALNLVASGLLEAVNKPVINVTLNEMKLLGSANIDTSVSPFQLKDFTFNVNLGGTKVSLTEILNNDKVTQELEDLLNDQLPTIVGNVSTALEPVVDLFGKHFINLIIRVGAGAL